MDMRNKEVRLRAAAILLIGLLGGYQAAVSGQYLQQLRWPENVVDPGFSVTSPWPSIGRVSHRAAEGGLRAGERLIAIQGQPYAGEVARNALLDKYFPGDRIRVTVESSNKARRDAGWQLEAADGGQLTPGHIAFHGLMNIGMPILCLVVGFWVVLARPRDTQAWLLLGMLASFSHAVVQPAHFSGPRAIVVLFYELNPLLRGLWPLFMFLFAWEFPQRTSWQERNPWLRHVTVAALLLCSAVIVAQSVPKHWGDPESWSSWIDAMSYAGGTARYVQMFAISAFFALLAYKRYALPDKDSRGRLRTIFVGAVLSLTPIFVLVIASRASGESLEHWGDWIIVPALLALCLFPVTLAYVIVVHRAFGLRVVIRQGLRYALARRGVRVLQAFLILGVMLTAVAMAIQPGMNRPQVLKVVAIGTLVVVFLERGADLLGRWVDRHFFREAYHAELVLANLSDDVRTMVETKLLLKAVATRIGQALHVDRIALLLREGNQFEPAYALGMADGASTPLPGSSRTAEVLRRERAPLRVYLDDTNSWVYREGLSGEERAWLAASQAELLLPLAVKDRLLGFVSLGRKRSEEPYSRNDLRLLQSVAMQTGLALENSQLAAGMAEAVAQRERLNREVEIAHEVQERLLPQNLPEIEGVDYFGYCRPARGVGGDSYDFLQLETGLFAISIGDVSGKGIPAALLMASLQSALRGQAMSRPSDLGEMIGALNRLIYDSSPSNRYATLFYGQYDPKTRVMTYVNAGHNPPMVMRGSEVLRLETGGPVVGLFRPSQFTQGTFQALRGDVFVGFTDGVSEAMDAREEEWGEESLEAFLRANHQGTARELILQVMAAADAYSKGAPQHDDMTLVVARVL